MRGGTVIYIMRLRGSCNISFSCLRCPAVLKLRAEGCIGGLAGMEGVFGAETGGVSGTRGAFLTRVVLDLGSTILGSVSPKGTRSYSTA